MSYGPQTVIGQKINSEKHRLEGETFVDAQRRISRVLADDESHRMLFEEILLNQRFCPAGRIQSGIGTDKTVTAMNCFASCNIDDSFVEGEHSIMHSATMAASTMRAGGGIGYNFGSLRPKGSFIRGLRSQSSGPISFMHIFNAVCQATSSAGNRRGAQMGVMPIGHPDIREFINCKRPPDSALPIMERVNALRLQAKSGKPEDIDEFWKWYSALQTTLKLTGFNISVDVSDKFMECLENNSNFDLVWGGKKFSEVASWELWGEIMQSTWLWAEPGVLFLDNVNRMNNLRYCEKIFTTNPCGEQPLPPFGACLLGSFNLTKYVHRRTDGSFYFDMDQLRVDIPVVVRAMDNVVDRTKFALPQQKTEAINKRRMGLGVMGVANAIEALGFAYGSPDFIKKLSEILELICRESYKASISLAREKGAFPMFDPVRYTESNFINSAIPDLVADIKRYGIRNSHLTSIAPTGTISMGADNVSSGIEPVFSYSQERTIIMPEGPIVMEILDYGVANFGVKGRKATSLSAEDHLNVQIAAQKFVDSSISKTCNVSPDMPFPEFSELYRKAHKAGLKGCTTFNPGGMRAGILVDNDKEGSACTVDSVTGARSCE